LHQRLKVVNTVGSHWYSNVLRKKVEYLKMHILKKINDTIKPKDMCSLICQKALLNMASKPK